MPQNLTRIDVYAELHIDRARRYVTGLSHKSVTKLLLHRDIPGLDVASSISLLVDGRGRVCARQRNRSIAKVRKLNRRNSLLQGSEPVVRVDSIVGLNQQGRIVVLERPIQRIRIVGDSIARPDYRLVASEGPVRESEAGGEVRFVGIVQIIAHAVHAEQRRGAAVVGLDPAIVPASAAELAAYYARMRPLLRATPEARKALLRSILPAVPEAFRAFKLVAPPMTTLAFATLPRWARRMYGVPASPLADLTATAALRACYQGSSGVAGQLLLQPAARAARQRMRTHRRDGQHAEPSRAAS